MSRKFSNGIAANGRVTGVAAPQAGTDAVPRDGLVQRVSTSAHTTEWAGTQSAYDAITTKDATTLYFIAG